MKVETFKRGLFNYFYTKAAAKGYSTLITFRRSKVALSNENKDKINHFYLYSSSSISVPEKWVGEGEIDPGLDGRCFMTVGDISADFGAAFVSSAMFCFL